jgi:hypothetical protein
LGRKHTKGASSRQIKRSLRRAEQRRSHQVETFTAALDEAKAKDLPPSESEEQIFDIDYEITDEPLVDPAIAALPKDEQAAYERAYELVYDDPKRAVAPLERLVEKYPDIPTFANNLLVAYSRTRSSRHVDARIIASYERDPNYLFARLNYISLLLGRGRENEVLQVLDGKLRLDWLYPERAVFHVTEHVTFLATIGRYFAAIGRFTMALRCWEIAVDCDEDHPSVALLEQALRKSPLPLALDLMASLEEEGLLDEVYEKQVTGRTDSTDLRP